MVRLSLSSAGITGVWHPSLPHPPPVRQREEMKLPVSEFHSPRNAASAGARCALTWLIEGQDTLTYRNHPGTLRHCTMIVLAATGRLSPQRPSSQMRRASRQRRKQFKDTQVPECHIIWILGNRFLLDIFWTSGLTCRTLY